MVTVKDIMHGVTVVNSEKTVIEVAELMTLKKIGSVLVRHNGEVTGILTERDLMTRVVARGEDPRRLLARHIMSPILYTVRPEADIFEASEMIAKYGIRRLPVLDTGGVFIGIVTARSIAKALPEAVVSKITMRAPSLAGAGGYFE